MVRPARWLSSLVVCLLLACGDDDNGSNPGTAAGSSGSSGHTAGGAGTGGTAGTGGAAGTGGTAGGAGGAGGSGAGGSGAGGAGAGGAGAGGAGAAGMSGVSGQSGAAGAAGQGGPTAAQLLARLGGCMAVSKGKYKTDDEDALAETISICGTTGAVWWQADMDVDCDGQPTTECNLDTDPAFQPETSVTDGNDEPLVAAQLPYVVIPLPSSRFDYTKSGLTLGSVVAVLYQGQIRYGIFGDEGPENIIGEASYAMAKSLGVNPDPSNGGTDGPVTYIAFTGPGSVVENLTDQPATVALGVELAQTLLTSK